MANANKKAAYAMGNAERDLCICHGLCALYAYKKAAYAMSYAKRDFMHEPWFIQ